MEESSQELQNGEAVMSEEERRRSVKRWINGELMTEIEWEERMRQQKLRAAAYLEKQREEWVKTPQGKLCVEFYRKFQEYKQYLESQPPSAWKRGDGGPLEFVEHQLFEHGLKVIREFEEARVEKDRRNLEQARRAARCEHRHADGRRCGSPKTKGKHLCYMHEQVEAAQAATKIDLGSMEDPAGIQLAIVRLQRAILDGLVDPRQSGMLAYLIQLATNNVKNIKAAEHALEDFEEEADQVDEVDAVAAKVTENLISACLEESQASTGELPEAGG